MSDERRGLAFGFAAYLIWGAFPLYWPLLEPSGPVEILAHRMVWSLVAMGLLALVLRRATALRAVLADRRAAGLLTLGAAMITVNWGTYIYGVNSDRVVETSLGYFINPLVTVLLGVVVLGERLRGIQWAALAVGLVAVVVLTVGYGRPPLIALTLAFSFGTYGLVKKSAGVGAIESLTFETAIIAPVAATYLVWLGLAGQAHFSGEGPGHVALLVASGAITAVPLLCFGAAATRVSMTTLGLVQYLTPTLQFALGVTLLGEHMPPERWIGFGLVWVALAMFTADAVRHHRQGLADAARATAV